MTQFGPFPGHKIAYGRSGKAEDGNHAADLRKFVTDNGLDDLLVLSHGWRNDEEEASALYNAISTHLGNLLTAGSGPAQALSGRKIGVMGVYWPSKPFREFGEFGSQDGGAASTGADDATLASLADLTDLLADDVPADVLQELSDKAKEACDSSDAFPAYFDTLRKALAIDEDDDELEDADDAAFSDANDSHVVQAQLEAYALSESDLSQQDMQAGGAASGLIGGARGAVGLTLNLSTFYKMKKRAGKVGKNGVAESLRDIRSANPKLGIHMAGHSFGARVLTMATLAIGGAAGARPDSLSLLQAAFSHNSFAIRFPPRYTKSGFFRPVVGNNWINGPMMVTHTHNDKAVTKAYALASRLSGHNASAVGGTPSQFGGLGANGALHTDEASKGTLLPADGSQTYVLAPGKIYNLKSDQFIKEHSDVDGPEVAFAIMSAMAS